MAIFDDFDERFKPQPRGRPALPIATGGTTDACCDPILDLQALHGRQRRVLVAVLVINILTFGMMAIASFTSRSTSLLSGGLDNMGDALTYALSLAVVGATLARQARVAFVKGLLIMAAAVGVAGQIVFRLLHPTVPVFETMGVIGAINLAANGVCLWLLTPYRHGDVNLASAWECSRNDIYEGTAVLAAAGAVYIFGAGWPDLLVAVGLLVLFVRSSIRVLRKASTALHIANDHGPGPGKVQDLVCKCFIDEATAMNTSSHRGRTYSFCDPSCKAKFDAQPDRYVGH